MRRLARRRRDPKTEEAAESLAALSLASYSRAELLRAGQLDTDDPEEVMEMKRALEARYRDVRVKLGGGGD